MKKRIHLALVICLFSLLIFSCRQQGQWTHFRGEKGTGEAASIVTPPIGIRWEFRLQEQKARRRVFNQPLLVDKTVYFGSSDGNFYSLNLDTGYMNWTFRTGGPINSVAHVDEESVYFGSSDGIIYAVDRNSGKEKWVFETRAAVDTTVVGYKGMIAAASNADAVYFLDAVSGTPVFQLENHVWHRLSYMIRDNKLFFAPGDEERPFTLGAYDLDTMSYLWQMETGDDLYDWYGFAAVEDDRLYFGSSGTPIDGNWNLRYSCLDLVSGISLWEQYETAVLPEDYNPLYFFTECVELLDYLAPVIWRNRVIFASGDLSLRSFNRKNGDPVWVNIYDQPLSTAPTLAGSRLYFGIHELAMDDVVAVPGKLVCASASDGKTLWEIEVEGSILNAPVIAGRWIIFATDRGRFYVLEQVFG